MTTPQVREAADDDLDRVLAVHRQAFGQETEAGLVRDLLADPSAAPRLSLLATDGGRPVGHILFTAVTVAGAHPPVAAAILAPLAVVPGAQGRGIGRRLVEDGLRRLAASGTDLVFVLGDPQYYGRFGFEPASPRGLAAPYPLPEAYAEAWLVRRPGPGAIGTATGRVDCAEMLRRPELWQE
ncbi:MAG: N-acetyltransferase [Rhodospirillaceae bacterium]|nr:N-acetyltransferase [Rhodospirillaceae bacterium]